MSLRTYDVGSRPTHLRVAFPSSRKVDTYEPSKIHIAYEYILLENLYSSLVEIDPQGGRILPGVAKSFDWVDNELHLQIRDDLKTSSGRLITASDVVFSLKRVVILAGNTHGNFKDLVCPGITLKNVEDDCPGIAARGNTLVLSPGGHKTILLSMLAATDFAVIPQSSVDPETLAIRDYSETSGLYYVESDDGFGRIRLKINPHHYHASSEIAQTVALVPFNAKGGETALDLFRASKVDHVLTTNSTKIEDLISYGQGKDDVQVHATMKIRNFILVFTEKGRKKLSLEQRRWMGEQVRGAFAEAYNNIPGYQGSHEFFPVLGEGGLSESQQLDLKKVRSSVSATDLPQVKIALLKAGDMEFWSTPIKKRLPGAQMFLDRVIPDLHTYAKAEDMPDAFIAGTDTGFMEDINLISYSLNAGYLGVNKSARDSWLKSYMEMPSKEDRMGVLRDLHFEALHSASIVPLVISPFVALARKPWNMELSELYANNQLWLVKNH